MPTTPIKDVQDEILSTVRKSQETALEAIRTWVDTVQSIAPKLPVPSVPFAAYLPRPEEVVARAYDLAEALLAGQRKFAEALLASQRKFAGEGVKATSGLLPGSGKGPSSPEASPAE